ncbi:MAG TPA: GTPase HflX [Nitrososphaeraceae archaeon]|nr:GTPase HflX [Nitrososphaeraceae archaeon]
MTMNKSALLITYPVKHIASEAKSLAESAGYSILRTVTQKHLTRSKFGIGKGKADEVRELVKSLNIEYIIFDEILKPTQQYNLAKLCEIDTIDREKLILEIFRLRSNTEESRIQIKLAELHYEAVRIKEKVRLAKRGEQPGFFGLGKYDADVHLLDIRRRISILRKKLLKEEKRKLVQRAGRARSGFPTVSIMGYTSVGKTTLFNFLTGESKLVGIELFTTLSTSSRIVNVYGNKVMFSDTVGFISKLPAYMIDAFKSTLQELNFSNVILLVLDISQSYEILKKQLSSTFNVMIHLGVSVAKIIYVFNKVDLVKSDEAMEKCQQLGILNEGNKNYVMISSKTGLNVSVLLDVVRSRIFVNTVKVEKNNVNRST